MCMHEAKTPLFISLREGMSEQKNTKYRGKKFIDAVQVSKNANEDEGSRGTSLKVRVIMLCIKTFAAV